ncbi:hypothetical protein SADUNF_Sadunf11G0114100 [Salix dunnii]|uniref:DUF4005 domain-containing protein n=1 Tax=Salix dunnii TaxID=1413687 RepID=A0A835JU99_9ROSI|nr:hypothetical protein SADUNF_Sadunf11G0114100 [Salix dunnii]
MGKKGGTSWLTMVKRAFRSPSKENEKKSSRRGEEHDQEEDEKKKEKRRWLFRKPSSDNHAPVQRREESIAITNKTSTTTAPSCPPLDDGEKLAIAVAAATAATADAAAVTAQASAEIVRLTRPASIFVRAKLQAAIVIQTAFRGYLARRALRALKGLVKLQAVVRGHNVRKQAKITLQCMEALVRVQDQVRDQRARVPHEWSRRSMFSETNSSWEFKYLHDIRERKHMSRDVSSVLDDWDDRRCTNEEIEAMVESKKEAAIKREKALAYAFSSQIWRSRRNPSAGDEKELEERARWLDRWMATKQWETSSRASTDRKDSNIKTVEMDTSRPFSYSTAATSQRLQTQNHLQKHPPRHSVASPFHRSHSSLSLHQSPITPSPCKPKPLRVRSASPRCLKEENKCYSAAHTPSLSSRYFMNNDIGRCGMMGASGGAATMLPNYMAATESAKARVRTQSAPRQRPSTPEREHGGSAAKKRLSFPVPDHGPHGNCGGVIGYSSNTSFSQNLRSPSFKSVHGCHFGMGEKSNYFSGYNESIGGEISPCSTTDLMWLK